MVSDVWVQRYLEALQTLPEPEPEPVTLSSWFSGLGAAAKDAVSSLERASAHGQDGVTHDEM